MRARAPGKVVLSGAYAVLEGAPGIVAAVDRYAIADTSVRAAWVTEEVRAAFGERPPPGFDASALREGSRKLGLGSSAAILVASLGAIELEHQPALFTDELAKRIFPRAIAAHAQAQAGGSGIDVAASVYGGVLQVVRSTGGLGIRPVTLPHAVRIQVLSLGRPASTRELIGLVKALAARDPRGYARSMQAQADASERAAQALTSGDARGWIAALTEQAHALTELGARAGASIVTLEIAELLREAEAVGAAVLPAGAGGGDVALWVSAAGAPAFAERPGITCLRLRLGAEGVHAIA